MRRPLNLVVWFERIKTALAEGNVAYARAIRLDLYREALQRAAGADCDCDDDGTPWGTPGLYPKDAERILRAENLGIPEEE